MLTDVQVEPQERSLARPRMNGPWDLVIRSRVARAGAGSGIGGVIGTLAGICAVLIPGLAGILGTPLFENAPLAVLVITAAAGAVVGAMSGALLGVAFRDARRPAR
jgi:membrane associated rhomboid family serine protease